MCVVSFIGDHYSDKWKDKWEPYIPKPEDVQPFVFPHPQISRQEFDNLKKEVEEMRELLRKAKIYDEKNNEPNCEIEDKMKLLREIAKLVGIDLDDVINKSKQ